MVRRNLFTSFLGCLAALTSSLVAYGQQSSAYELLPSDTQAVVWIRSSDELAERWNRTQLAKLIEDESVAPFFNEQRQAIEKRFIEAGWRLNVQPEDLSEYATGQIAIAWSSKDTDPLKPFALALIADVDDDEQLNSQMMSKFESQLDPKKSQKSESSHRDVTITKYRLPPRPGELIHQDSYFAILQGTLISTDDADLIKQLIDRIKDGSADSTLATDTDFIEGRKLAGVSGDGQIEYFVRPLGFAKILRSIGGERSKSDTDILAILETQGFTSIRCVCGEVGLGLEKLDVLHNGYVYADTPLPKSAGILDFANEVDWDVPSFVGEKISTFLSTNWNAGEAFWKAEGLVDAFAGTEGVFDEVIEGIKKDINGPQIDIENEFLPLLTNEIFSISDSKAGEATTDSRRNLIALKVKDTAKMAKLLKKAMKPEPDASEEEFQNVTIWKVEHPDNVGDENEFGEFGGEFDEFGGGGAGGDDAPEPWLNSWAIAAHGDFLMFASHEEMIKEAIQQAAIANVSPLTKSEDYKRVVNTIAEFFGNGNMSGWKLSRNQEAYRVQYELFRRGELKQSQSMLATILDRILDSESEIKNLDQKIQGNDLPEYSAISHYLQPSGVMARSTDKGWKFGSFMLGSRSPRSISLVPQLGTAQRVSKQTQSARR